MAQKSAQPKDGHLWEHYILAFEGDRPEQRREIADWRSVTARGAQRLALRVVAGHP